ncbi:MAG: polysaccharide biosynthesis tyrosine autokinase [Nitrospirae bacterium YQR-1]
MQLRYFIELLHRRRVIILTVFAVIFLTITLGTLAIAPSYDSTAKIMLKRPGALNVLSSAMGVTTESSTFTSTDRADYLALSSLRPTAERVVKKLSLKRIRFRQRVLNALPFLKPLLRPLGVDIDSVSKEMTAEQLLSSNIMTKIFPRPNIKITQIEDTDLFTITAKGANPEAAADIANAMAEAIVHQEISRVSDAYKYADQFIDDNIDKVKTQALENLEKIKDFQEKEKAVALDTQTTNILTDLNSYTKNIETNNVSIAKTKVSISKVESQLRNVPAFAKDGSTMGNSDLLSFYKQKLATLYQTYSESKTKYTKNHPTVMDVENQISMVKELLQKEYEKVFDSKSYNMDDIYMSARKNLITYYLELDGYYAQNRAYPEIIKKYEQKLASIPQKQLTSTALTQEATATNTVYSNLLTYKYRVGLMESIEMSNINIVEPAIVHEKSTHKHPSFFLNLIIAVFLGFVLSLLSALIMEILDSSVKGVRDIKGLKNIALLGAVKKLKEGHFGPSAATQVKSFKTISNSISMIHRNTPVKTIVVSSTQDGEGKSFLSSNLALSMANEGKKVLLIDADTTANALSTILKVSNTPGLSDFLTGKAADSSIINSTGVAGLFLIPAGEAGLSNLISERFAGFLNTLERNYDFIIIDTPSLLSSDEALLIGSHTGKNLVIVVENERTRIDVLSGIFSNFKTTGINFSGVVLNKVETIEFGSEYYTTIRYFPKNEAAGV